NTIPPQIMTNHPTLYSFPTGEQLSKNLAEAIIAAQNAAIERHETFRIGVSGGSLPKYLSSPFLLEHPELQLSTWEVFYADERCVPNSDAESNHKAFVDNFLRHLPQGIKPKAVHTLDERLLHQEFDTSCPLFKMDDIPTQ